MALITDAATAWYSPITLTPDEVWQTRTVSYRMDGPAAMMIIREDVWCCHSWWMNSVWQAVA